jgi:hypothetical protein
MFSYQVLVKNEIVFYKFEMFILEKFWTGSWSKVHRINQLRILIELLMFLLRSSSDVAINPNMIRRTRFERLCTSSPKMRSLKRLYKCIHTYHWLSTIFLFGEEHNNQKNIKRKNIKRKNVKRKNIERAISADLVRLFINTA